jgi:protein-L-isoaspartate(D-aspartate) O-methyltransferase
MFNLLEIRSTNRVLEIGTGSGYGTAILANLAGEVVSVERFQSLVLAARTRLAHSSLENVTIILDDGCNGNASNGPFDRILLSGSILSVPESLIRQLAPEGILVCVVSGSGIPLLCRYRKGINAAPEPEIIGPFHLSLLIPGISTIL